MKILVLILGFFLISSCTFHRGMMSGDLYYKTSDTDFLKFSTGRSSTIRVLGIGGAKTQGTVFAAKSELYSNYPLKEGQSYANFSVDIQDFYFLLFTKTTAIVSADIIGPSQAKMESLSILPWSKVYVKRSDNLYTAHFVKRLFPNNQLLVKPLTYQRGLDKVIVNSEDVFLTVKPVQMDQPFQSMDKVKFYESGELTEGLITGFQIDRVLIKIIGANSRFTIKKYSEISII